MSRYRTVLAIPHTQLGSKPLGLLEPIFEIRNGETVRSDPNDYPNRGLIFTPNRYDEIEDNFPPGTLVQLQIEENLSSSLPPNDPAFAKYIVAKEGISEPDRWLVQVVIEHPFSVENRTIVMDDAPRHPLWVRDPDTHHLYGPFDTSGARKLPTGEMAFDLQPPATIPFAPNHPEHTVAKLSYRAVETEEIDDVEYLYFTRAEFEKKTVEWIDYSTDKALLELAQSLASTHADITPAQLESLQAALANAPASGSGLDKERVRRAAKLLDKVAGWQEHRQTLIEEYLTTEAGRSHLDRYLDNHQEKLLDQAFEKHHDKLNQRIHEHTMRLTAIAAEIEERNAELEELKKIDTDALRARKAELESELQDQRDELKTIKDLIDAGNESINLNEVLWERQSMLDELVHAIGVLTEERDELEAVRTKLREEAQADLNELRGRLTSLKPYVDTLTGASVKVGARISVEEPRITRAAPASLGELVDKMHEALQAANHHVGKKDVANAFTGILTSPLTILAGLPGVGKTSLVTRLAEILGLARGSQFLTVRVPRGWRSRQDILGYHNPITAEYEQAPTGLYSLLQWHQKRDPAVPAWVLFDEANLSAPEHYLSDLLPMMDEAADRRLATGAPGESFQVPEHARFIFTINQDHSVESLTPRVLDRAAVIHVPPPETIDAVTAYTQAVKPAEGTLTVEMLEKLLAAVPTTPSASEDATFKKIVKVLHDSNPDLGVPTRISPRKNRRVIKHTTTMRHILGVNTGLDALDHAIASHVLPLVRGSGKNYRARLDALTQEVESLPVSASLLARIVAAGEANFDEYNYQTLA